MKNETCESKMQLIPYEGKEDYIFISYSHQDMGLVLPVLRCLHENGIRFWYDEGIDPGSEWPESIARHLNGCRGCLAFISPNSLASPNCRREVNFALSKNKEFLSIFLTPAEMTLGMEMQISSYQSIMKYRYQSDGQFLEKLLSVETILNCRNAQPPNSGMDGAAAGETSVRNDGDLHERDGGPERKKNLTALAAVGGILAVLLLVLALTLSGRPSGTGTSSGTSTGPAPEQPAVSRPDSVLMSDRSNEWSAYPGDLGKYGVFGSGYVRNQISAVAFWDTLDGLPADAWDVSEAGDGSVMAWVEPNGSLFDLNIGAEGGVIAPVDCSYLFAGYESMGSIRFNGVFNTANATNMLRMFWRCRSLEELDVSGFDTAKVISMRQMFANCGSLKNLDLSNFDTTRVKSMDNMFGACGSLESLDLSGFDTADVTDMHGMFSDCGSMRALDVSGFDTSNVTDMSFMFSDCGSLETLDLSGFNTANVTDMGHMFWECGSLRALNVSGFDTARVTNMGAMFYKCSSLEALDLSSFDTANTTDMGAMFFWCSSLKALDLSSFDTANVTDMHDMFDMCKSIKSLDLSGLDTSNVINMHSMFAGCDSLEELDVSGFDTSNVTDMGLMFSGCGSLETLDLSSFDVANVTAMNHMFSDCEKLTALYIRYWNTSDINTNNMFKNCSLFLDAVDAILSGITVSLTAEYYDFLQVLYMG